MKSWARAVLRAPVAASLVVGVAAAIALAPTPAFAESLSGLQYLTGSTANNSEVYKAVTLSCPTGQRVIGGGYQLLGALGSVVLDDFIPSTTTLTVGAGEVVGPGEPADGTTENWSVSATVVCAIPPPSLEIVTTTSAFASGADRTVTANCPSGKVPIGSGASLSNGFGQISIDRLQVDGSAVGGSFVSAEAEADEDGYSGSWSITAYAVCANPLPGFTITAGPTQSSNFSSMTAIAQCPAGTRALGVGWLFLAGRNELLVTSATFFNSNSSVHDIGSVDADGRSGAWSLQTEAICAAV